MAWFVRHTSRPRHFRREARQVSGERLNRDGRREASAGAAKNSFDAHDRSPRYVELDRGRESSKHLSTRQKWGLFHLLLWRECFPWLSFQILPIMLYWIWWLAEPLDWLIPVFVFTSALTLSTGPGQVLLTYIKSDPEIRRRGKWFVLYLVASVLFYTEYKNLIARLSQFKEIMREQEWKVTSRS
jgi:hypothetical protein